VYVFDVFLSRLVTCCIGGLKLYQEGLKAA
jgi:hypothetical protein